MKRKIAIADDHPLFRRGMAAMLRDIEDVELVIEAGDGEELLDKLAGADVDVLLLDLSMPVMDGIEATRQLRQHYPHIRILILTMHDEEDLMDCLREEGAAGYLLKNASVTEISEAIDAVAAGGTYFNQPALLPPALPYLRPTPQVPLSERELEVLRLISEGQTAQEIAGKLCLSVRTIDGHRTRMLEKTNTRNTAELVALAVRSGWL